ncbi:MAG: hypothetical protein M0030_02580 [Actinomycetota bacterium]|nr:hypothetical protein [Actinomycetota bacterium]
MIRAADLAGLVEREVPHPARTDDYRVVLVHDAEEGFREEPVTIAIAIVTDSTAVAQAIIVRAVGPVRRTGQRSGAG